MINIEMAIQAMLNKKFIYKGLYLGQLEDYKIVKEITKDLDSITTIELHFKNIHFVYIGEDILLFKTNDFKEVKE